MTDVASLSMSVDYSQVTSAAGAINNLVNASRQVSTTNQDMSRSVQDMSRNLTDYARSIDTLAGTTRTLATQLDQLTSNVVATQTAFRAGTASINEFVAAMQQMDGVARSFGISASSLENFNRVARNIGLNAQETYTALNRVKEAIEGVTAAGQQARSVMMSAGVNFGGTTVNDADRLLRQFMQGAGNYRGDPNLAFAMSSVVGPMSAETAARLYHPSFTSEAQRIRSLQDAERDRQAAGIREQIMYTQEWGARRSGRMDELQGMYGWDFTSLFESRNDTINRLEARDRLVNSPEGRAQGLFRRSDIFDSGMFGRNGNSIGALWDFWNNGQYASNSNDIWGNRFELMRDRYGWAPAMLGAGVLDFANRFGAYNANTDSGLAGAYNLPWLNTRPGVNDTRPPPAVFSAAAGFMGRVPQLTQQYGLDASYRSDSNEGLQILGSMNSMFNRPEFVGMSWQNISGASDTMLQGFGWNPTQINAFRDSTRATDMYFTSRDRNLNNLRETQGMAADRVSSAGRPFYMEGDTLGGDRARVIQQIEESNRRIKDDSERERAIRADIAQYDRQIADMRERQLAALVAQNTVATNVSGATNGGTGMQMLSGILQAQLQGQAATSKINYADLVSNSFGSALSSLNQSYATGMASADIIARVAGRGGGSTADLQREVQIEQQTSQARALANLSSDPAGANRAVDQVVEKLQRLRDATESAASAMLQAAMASNTIAMRAGTAQISGMSGGQMADRDRIIATARQADRGLQDASDAEVWAAYQQNTNNVRTLTDNSMRASYDYGVARNAPNADIALRMARAGSIADPVAAAREMYNIQRQGILNRGADPLAPGELSPLDARFAAGLQRPSNEAVFNSNLQTQLSNLALQFYSGGGYSLPGLSTAGAATLTGPGRMNPGGSPGIDAILAAMRQELGLSLSVTSGDRPGDHGSQHALGNARDVSLAGLSREDRQRVYQWVADNPYLSAGQYGSASNMLHIDDRAGARMVWGPPQSGGRGSWRDLPYADPDFARIVGPVRGAAVPGGGAQSMAAQAAGPGVTVAGSDNLYDRVYGTAGLQFAQSMAQLASRGPVTEEARTAMATSEATRALMQFAQTTNQAALSVQQLGERAGRTPGEQAVIAGRQQGEGQAAMLRSAASLPGVPDALRRQLLAAAGAAPGLGERDAIGRRSADLENGLMSDRRQLELGEYEAGLWYMSDSSRSRAMNRYRAQQSLNYDYPNATDDQRRRVLGQADRRSDLEDMTRQSQALRDGLSAVGNAAVSAFDQIVLRGGNAKQVMASLLGDLASYFLKLASRQMLNGAGDLLGNLFGLGGGAKTAISGGSSGLDLGSIGGAFHGSALGNAYGSGHLIPFATGGVIDGMQFRPMANGGTAMMGEAGPEAVLPLTRLPSGKLGVASGGGSGMTNNFNVTVNTQGSSGDPNKDRDHAQMISKELHRSLEGMVIQTLQKQMRGGGMFGPGNSQVIGTR